MSLKECLDRAAAQGAINTRQADELLDYYNARFSKKREGMSDAQAHAEARKEVADELRHKAARETRNALLSEAKRKELAPKILNHKSLYGNSNPLDGALSQMVHYGEKGMRSYEGRKNGIISLMHRDLAEVMHHFRQSKILGRRGAKIDLPDLVRALTGENVNNPIAAKFASTIDNIREDLRLRFNRAGGDMPKREGFDFNHTHNTRKMLDQRTTLEKVTFTGKKTRLEKREEWKFFIKPLLNPDLMTFPDGSAVGAGKLDEALNVSWEKIVSDGAASLTPTSRPSTSGAISNKYQDARFLQFKDADAWLKYNDEFGSSDPIQNIFHQTKSMAADIAALEHFGPNPDAQIEWLKQMVVKELGKNQAGTGQSPFHNAAGMSAAKAAEYRIDSLWMSMRGRNTVWQKPAAYASDVRNVASAAMLGSTGVLAAVTDPFIAAAARSLAGLPVVKVANSMFVQLAKDLKTGKGKLNAAKHAIIWDDYMHVMHDEARYVDQMFGHEWSKYMVDRALTWNALKPMTAARKRLEATIMHSELGSLAADKVDWIDMNPSTKRMMEGFGLSAKDWHKMRGGVDEMGFLSPATVLDKTGDRELAETYAEMIVQWSERAVPAGDPRVKSVIRGKTAHGTIEGELLEFATQFMGFSMSFTARQIEATYIKSMMGSSKAGKIGRGAGYISSLSLSLMLGAAFYEQFKAMADGKDPVPMDNVGFWAGAFAKGGGTGLFGDFVTKSENRFGQSFSSTLPGPGMAIIGDTLDLTVGNIWRLMRGDFVDDPNTKKNERFNAGRQLSNYVGRYTPILSSHPATRLAHRRYLVDNLQWLTDPQAHKSFSAKARKKPYYWKPGTMGPQRAPDF